MPRLDGRVKHKKLNSPLKWYGGKKYLANKILQIMPKHLHYVEPYFGSGAVLFSKTDYEGTSEVINDLNPNLMAFWRVMADRALFDEFKRRVEATPFSEEAWNNALLCSDDDTLVDIAYRCFVKYRLSRQALGESFATLSRNRVRRGMNEQVSAWWSSVDGLEEAYYRLRRVVIFNRDAIDVIKQQDGKHTLFYLDPPYLQDLRVARTSFGEYEMSNKRHKLLLDTLEGIKGKFILSGYGCKMYNEWCRKNGFWYTDFRVANSASSAKTKQKMVERIWCNFDVEETKNTV